MLKHLSIRNFILIRELEMDFHDGFTVITGETGAGKSIFLGALGLLLGDRADISTISDQNSKCIIEGIFDVSAVELTDFFSENELDFDLQCIVRREILPQGKSRAFVNDTPVGLNVLKSLSERLIDIHSQHSTILLSKNSFHLSLLDAVAGTTQDLQSYAEHWSDYQKDLIKIQELREKYERNEKERDYLTFLLNEIDDLKTFPGENEKLDADLRLMQNAEKIKRTLLEAASLIKHNEISIYSQLMQISVNLSNIIQYFTAAEEFSERLQSVCIELDDIASELSLREEKIYVEPSGLILIEERLNHIQKLLFKHKTSGSEELLHLRDEYAVKLSEIDSSNEQLAELEKKSEEKFSQLQSLAEKLSEKRKAIIPELEKNVREILASLAMPHAVFRVENSVSSKLNSRGIDEIKFYFSANKGEEPKELSKIASGGEMSRMMLALKSIIAKTSSLPTLIFDEIDSGISGETSMKMSEIFDAMGKSIQLIVITHLPQIAARAHRHMLVSKKEAGEKTYTVIEKLEQEARIAEIAKMLGGEQYSNTAYETAREMFVR